MLFMPTPEEIALPVSSGDLISALGRLQAAEQRLADALLRYMRLNQSDMRALNYLIECGNQGLVATPGAIAAHLHISTASTTKLLDRLQRAGHITRQAHPSDRRALAIAITPETHQAALRSVSSQQARRCRVAARLTPAERQTVMRFLDDMASEVEASESEPGGGET